MSESSQRHRLFLRDFGQLLRERALEARGQAKAGGDEFHEGRLTAYYEVLSSMLGMAETFEIPETDLGLTGLNPDRDLLSRPK